MINAAKTPSVRRMAPLCVAFGVAVALLLAGLLASSSAQAQADVAGEAPLSGEQSEQNLPPGEEVQWPAEPAPPAPEESAGAPPSSEAPPASEEPAVPPTEPPPAETAPAQTQEVETAPPPAEEPVPPVAEAPPSEVPPPPPVEPPPPPAEVEAPPVEEAPAAEAPPPAEEPAEVVEHEEKVGKLPVEAAGEETTANSQPSTGAPSTPAASVSETGAAPEIETSLWPGQLPITPPPSRSKGQATPASCGLEASIATSCGVGWLSLSTQSTSAGTVLIASGSISAMISGAESEDDTHRRTSVQNAPSSPTPAQGPGGSGGVSAAGGGSSAACSAFASAGVKLRHSQISTRAVILDQPSWRTSFFVLVPERPG